MVNNETEEVMRRWDAFKAKVLKSEKELKNSNKTLALVSYMRPWEMGSYEPLLVDMKNSITRLIFLKYFLIFKNTVKTIMILLLVFAFHQGLRSNSFQQ